MQTNVESMDH